MNSMQNVLACHDIGQPFKSGSTILGTNISEGIASLKRLNNLPRSTNTSYAIHFARKICLSYFRSHMDILTLHCRGQTV